MDEKFDILCIFTNNGATYTFRDGIITCNNQTVLCFEYTAMSDTFYTAMSDTFIKTATFLKENMCGWSTTRGNI